MRHARPWIFAVLVIVVFSIGRFVAPAGPSRASAAENRVTAPFASEVDRMMGLLGNGQIDDAMGPSFLPNDPAQREVVRSHLIDLRNAQSKYLGYDIVAVQRLSDRLQIASVLAYYDVRPVLFKMHFYRPTGRAEDPWTVLKFDIYGDDVLEQLHDVPTDYPGHALAVRY